MSMQDSPEGGAPPGPDEETGATSGPAPAQLPFPVVGVGASAGGLEAYSQFLSHLPACTGMAFVLVQHLDPRHESRLAVLLSRATAMPVVEATNDLLIEPDHVYVIAPNSNLAIGQGVLVVTPCGDARRPNYPIDHLFRSLAEAQRARAIAVVLSGSGSDGTLGLCEIKAVGGITFAQDEKTAKQPGMPHSAIDSGCVDFVLPPEEIARRLVEIAAHPYLAVAPPPAPPPLEDAEGQYKKILTLVRGVMGVDFTMYRDTTIKRRIMRRMALHAQESMDGYAQQLAADRREVLALYNDLLINVTSFFRDPEIFEALKERVFPEIAAAKAASAPVRVWVAGCSTGQEAYSLAIALLEFYDDKPVRPPLQIFATDLSDQAALERARAGVYPETIEAEVSPERLRRFFKREDHAYRIDKTIRDMCVFARQNVAADPPFSHMDLISCRNLLIYLSTALQKRVLPTFHYALNMPGFLLLGTAETVGDSADLFEIVERSHKIYSKKASTGRPGVSFAAEDFRAMTAPGGRRAGLAGPQPADFQREADRILLGRYAPPGVLVNENLEILQYRGRTSPYLEAPPGEPTTSLLKMAREGIFLELRSALAEAKVQNQPVRRERLRVRGDGAGSAREIAIEVIPVKLPGTGEACFLVLFQEPAAGPAPGAAAPRAAEPAPPPDNEGELTRLRQEVAATKDYLQSMVEQQDAANEELRSANEEVLSSNEELQSTNEELETAKEELQSANEELTTVNEQLHLRNLELTQVNNDLTNLLSSTNIPVVMVGGDLRIRRFTGPARKAMSLLPTDVGRPIADIKPSVDVPDLDAIMSQVIDSVQPYEREVRDRAGRWYELRVYPYRTADHKIDGAVVVLLDIDQRKRAEEELRESDRRKDEFMAVLAHELRNPLSPISNAVEIIRRAEDDLTVIRPARDVLVRQVRQLSRIVEDLVDVSRVIAHKVELRRERVLLSTIVETALETSGPLMEVRGQKLTVALPPEPLYVNVDPVRISQVLINLLNNAAKFTEPCGNIGLTAELTGGKAQPAGGAPRAAELLLRIKDDGAGIRPELLPGIFDMFARGDNAPHAVRSGLGIGLGLSRSLVELHGGSIEARSAGPGKGTEILVRLPLSEVPPAAIASPEPAATDGGKRPPLRILVVDDNEDLADSMAMVFELMGHDVRVAGDGPSALAVLQTFVPDLAFVDIGLPGMSGHDLARRIREQPHLRKIMLIAQTGWGKEKDRRFSQEAGFDQHLVKPVSAETLKEIVDGVGRS